MIVVADSSPLIALINIECIHVLPALFQNIVIPTLVAEEFSRPARPVNVRDFIQRPPSWLSVQSPARAENIVGVHEGEQQAINLALQLRADLLLIDDLKGKKAARDRKLSVTGTIGVLERSAGLGLLDLETVFEHLKTTDFWIHPAVLDERLRLSKRRSSE